MNVAKTFLLTLSAVAIMGCGSSDEEEVVLLAPPPAGQGVQYQMVDDIDANSEVELCRFVQAPAEGLWINRDEVRYTTGSHHFLLYETAYDTVPDAKDDGTAVDTSGVFDCSSGATDGWSVTRLIGGSQNGSGDSMVKFPADVAMHVRPGAVLMMNAHYINASSAAISPEVRINLWTTAEENVQQEGDMLFWYNIFIKVPEQGSARAQLRCTVPEDITVTNVQSHMHSRGVGYTASFGSSDFYSNVEWEDVPVAKFEGGLAIPANTQVSYYCDYNNPEARDVYQGARSTDEMCMLIGSYYPAVDGLSNCSADPTRPYQTQGLGAEWVGGGSASCADTMTCIQSGEGEFFTNLQSCVVDSDSAVSGEVSAAVRCFLLAFVDGKNATDACATQFADCSVK